MPDVGDSVNVSTVPAVTMKIALAESLPPMFEVAATVYEVPGDAPDATEKLPASVPPVSAHEYEVNRPPGVEVREHVVPAKFNPEAVTS